MATITWYLTNGIADSCHQQMEDKPAAGNSTSNPNYGWTTGTAAAGNYARADAGTETGSLWNTTPIEPDGSITTTTNAGDCWRTKQKYTGRFAAGNWTFQMSVIAVTGGGAQDGNAGFRLFKGKATNGSDAVEVGGGGRMEGGLVSNLTTSTQQDSTNTTSLSAFSCDGEYIFVQVGWEITGAGGMNSDVIMRIGPTASLVTSSDFTPTATEKCSNTSTAATTGSGVDWSNLSSHNSSDDNYVLSQIPNLDDQSDYLDCTGFGFTSADIPVGSLINGIKVTVERSSDVINTIFTETAQLLIAGTPSGDNIADPATFWPTSDANVVYGGEYKLWGLLPTQSEVTASNFGFRIRAQNGSGNTAYARIDYIQLCVYFTPPAQAALTGTATMVSLGTAVWKGAAALSGQATLGPTASMSWGGAAALIGQATLGPTGSMIFSGAASLLGEATVAPTGSMIFSGALSFLGEATITALGDKIEGGGGMRDGAAELYGVATLSANGSVLLSASTSILAEAFLSPTGVLIGFSCTSLDEPQFDREATSAPGYSRQQANRGGFGRAATPSGGFQRQQPGQPGYRRQS